MAYLLLNGLILGAGLRQDGGTGHHVAQRVLNLNFDQDETHAAAAYTGPRLGATPKISPRARNTRARW